VNQKKGGTRTAIHLPAAAGQKPHPRLHFEQALLLSWMCTPSVQAETPRSGPASDGLGVSSSNERVRLERSFRKRPYRLIQA
jgi:hypothetical protein